MIGVGAILVLLGLLFALTALLNLGDASNRRRYRSALFWGLYATSLLGGARLGDFGNGCLAIAMVLVAGLGLGRAQPSAASEAAAVEARRHAARRWGNRLFVPALVVPLVTLGGTLALPRLLVAGRPLVAARDVTLVALGLGVVSALAVGLVLLRQPLLAPAREGRRLLDAIGWAAALPQFLAALGALFAVAGVGKVIAAGVEHVIPHGSRFAAVAAYTMGMALFTVIMGNGYAAFPVMTAGIGLPLVVQRFGGDAAIACALGMLSGFCGTLLTPMAANFNVVPALLLDLPDRHAVIKAQWPTALVLLAVNTALMYFLVFRY